jgi:hypothetical protein
MTLLTGDARPKGRIHGNGAAGWAVPNHADANMALLRYRLADVKMLVAEQGFDAGDQKFGRGTFILPIAGDLRARLGEAVDELGITAVGLDKMPDVTMHEVRVPRIALLHTWTNTQNEGWYRLAFDTLGVPYAYISDKDILASPDLRSNYDVIVFPPVSGSAQRLVNGIPVRGEPIPWKATDKYPNLTGPNGAQTDDMRGGMGLQGVLHLKRFIEEGGLFVAVAGTGAIPVDYGLVEGISLTSPPQLQIRGSVLNSDVAESASPIVYGYADRVPLYFSGAPVFTLSTGLAAFGGFGGGGQRQGTRATGRGGINDPDVPQARPLIPVPPRGEADEMSPEMREMARNLLPPEELRPRTILRWAPEKDLLVSGMLGGGSELAGKPAVIDAPLGKGHILFFANNPFWRMQTSGSYMLLFNAAMNFDNLTPKKAAPATPSDGKE